MSKKISKRKQRKEEQIEKPEFLEPQFESKYVHLVLIALLLLIVSVAFFDMGFRGYVPRAGDTMQWRSAAQVMIEYNEENPDQALWNTNIFSGMPGYHISFGTYYPFLNEVRRLVDWLINWRVLLLFTAGLGVYLLMIYLKFHPLIAFTSAIAFALSPHFIGLIEIGHNSKFMAIIYIPWVFLALLYLRNKRNILGLGLMALFIIAQLRENHPQISYYTFIMIGIYWIFNLIWSIKDGKFKKHLGFTGLLAAAFVISALAVAQPYLSTWQYGEYTIRGGAEGVGWDYATGWSFHPLEILTFLIPDFYGGVAPFYWGWMPFTQTSMYMGIIILCLAVIAIFYTKKRLVTCLGAVSVVTLLFSFGRHFPLLTNFLMNYLPGFNKFRVPAMILVLLQFAIVVLAGYGLKLIIEKYKTRDEKFFSTMRKVLIGAGVLLILFVAFSGAFESMSFEHANDAARYRPEQLQQLRTMRYERFLNDGYKAFIFLVIFFGIIYFLGKRKIGQNIFLALIAILVVADLLIVDSRFLNNLVHESTITREYEMTAADEYLLQDKEIFRIYPLGGEFGDNRWGHYHQTIGGYHGAKLRRYQDILDECLYTELQNRIPINWNVVNMLNVKYVIFGQRIPVEQLEYAFHDERLGLTVFKNKQYLPRAWFVQNVEHLESMDEILARLNDFDFDPRTTALVEDQLPQTFPPQQKHVQLTEFDLHELKFEVSTDTTALLTVSEIYYPAGWNAYLYGEEVEIYPVNHILRGVVIPPGEHVLEMKYEPKIYSLSLRLSLIGLALTLVLLLLGFYLYIRSNYRGEIVYVFKK